MKNLIATRESLSFLGADQEERGRWIQYCVRCKQSKQSKNVPAGYLHFQFNTMSADDNDTFDTYGAVTSKNKEEMIKEIAKAKPEKMILLKSVVHELRERNIDFWLDAGSLMGAYRHGAMVPHDFDLDLAVFGDENLHKAGEVLRAIKPEGYDVRYGHHLGNECKKYEIFKVGYECTDPKCVSLDIIMFTYNKEEDYVWAEFFAFGLEKNRYKYDWIFPLGKIMFEGMELPCPNNTEAYLTEQYGYLGPDCYYDKTTNKYRKREK